MGYFLPAAYLPGYTTRELALPRATGTLLLALLNAASVFGSVLIGVLCDRVRSTRTVLPVTALPSAAAVLLFWGLAGPRGRNRQQSSSTVLSSSTGGCRPAQPFPRLARGFFLSKAQMDKHDPFSKPSTTPSQWPSLIV